MPVPLVAFVNSRSGGQQGVKVYEKLKKYLPADHIFDLQHGGPSQGLLKYKGSKFRILVCGGDGTVGWVLSELEKLKFQMDNVPPIAILPIGTGNDLSRTLKWGGGFGGRGLKQVLTQVEKACVVHMDKWKITIDGNKPAVVAPKPEKNNVNGINHDNGAEPDAAAESAPHEKVLYMNNYFSVGSDAEIALQFHEARTAHPERYTSRVQNLASYVKLGIQHRPESLRAHIEVEIDGVPVEVPEKARTVVVLNLPSYAGGSNPWGPYNSSHRKRNFTNPTIDDGLVEVVAINGPMQIAAIHANVARGKKMGQGRNVKVVLKKAIATQVDGEPWKQQPSVINIQFFGTSIMLANSAPNAPRPSPDSPTLSPTLSPKNSPMLSASSTGITREGSVTTFGGSPALVRTLTRTRSSSVPIIHTASPLKYGPIDPAKRKKNRLYCEGCGIEFFLAHMLENHFKSGLCPASPSSSSDGIPKPGRSFSAASEDIPSSSGSVEEQKHSGDGTGIEEKPKANNEGKDGGEYVEASPVKEEPAEPAEPQKESPTEPLLHTVHVPEPSKQQEPAPASESASESSAVLVPEPSYEAPKPATTVSEQETPLTTAAAEEPKTTEEPTKPSEPSESSERTTNKVDEPPKQEASTDAPQAESATTTD